MKSGPNARRSSPDVAWVRRDRLAELPPGALEGFVPLCPDFVIELRSPSDRLTAIEAKMVEYAANGARLGWLIDPLERVVTVYRPGQPVERIAAPGELAGDPELPGLRVTLGPIWQPEL